MTSKPPRYIYWDSCVFLSYVNNIPDRVKILEAILDEITNVVNDRLLISSIGIVEVAYKITENLNGSPDPNLEAIIDALWKDDHVAVIEYMEHIGYIARSLMREGLKMGWKLKPIDAIHLATAKWVNENFTPIDEFQTYDESLIKYQTMIGIHICEPHTIQPKLI